MRRTYNPVGFTGREYDSETKLYFYRARYYDPQLGRFLSEDPIGLAGGINPYAYAGNDPVNHKDPYGLDAECVARGGDDNSCQNYSIPGVVVDPGKGDGESDNFGKRGPRTGPGGKGPGGSGRKKPLSGPEREQQGKMCLASTAFAALNVGLDLSGSRFLIGAGMQGVRIASAGKGMGGLAADVFAGKAATAFTPTPVSVTGNSVGFATGIALSGHHPSNMEIAKFVGGFVPVVGSVIAIGGVYDACSPLF